MTWQISLICSHFLNIFRTLHRITEYIYRIHLQNTDRIHRSYNEEYVEKVDRFVLWNRNFEILVDFDLQCIIKIFPLLNSMFIIFTSDYLITKYIIQKYKLLLYLLLNLMLTECIPLFISIIYKNTIVIAMIYKNTMAKCKFATAVFTVETIIW